MGLFVGEIMKQSKGRHRLINLIKNVTLTDIEIR